MIMDWQNRSLEDIEQKISHMQEAADWLVEGDIASLSSLERLFPSSMSFPDKVLQLYQDRAFYYSRMIELHDQAQADAVARVHTLREVFGFYANQILGGDVTKAQVDLDQQQLGVANLFVLSHSFLLHAKGLVGETESWSLPYIGQAEPLVSQQYDRYSALSKTSKREDLQAIESAKTFSPLYGRELGEASSKLELVTMKCGNNDVALAGANLDLFVMLAQESYFWQKNLAENSSLVFGGAIRPVDDLDHHTSLLKTALDRVVIYARRGHQLLTLSSMIADSTLELQEEAGLEAHLKQTQEQKQAQGPLYLPR